MRTYDKLIATIPDRRSDACVRPHSSFQRVHRSGADRFDAALHGF